MSASTSYPRSASSAIASMSASLSTLPVVVLYTFGWDDYGSGSMDRAIVTAAKAAWANDKLLNNL